MSTNSGQISIPNVDDKVVVTYNNDAHKFNVSKVDKSRKLTNTVVHLQQDNTQEMLMKIKNSRWTVDGFDLNEHTVVVIPSDDLMSRLMDTIKRNDVNGFNKLLNVTDELDYIELLNYANKYDRTDIIKIIFNTGEISVNIMLDLAIRNNNINESMFLLDYINIDTFMELYPYSLHNLILRGNLKLFYLLVDRLPLTEDEINLLVIAANHKHYNKLADYLLSLNVV